MRIDRVAELAGVSTRAVRHYHRVGALPEPARAANGYRDYRLDDVARLLRLRSLLDSGVPLRRIAALGDGPPTRGERMELLAELRRRRDDLAARIGALEAVLDAGDPGAVADDARAALEEMGRTVGLDEGALATERSLLDMIATRPGGGPVLAAITESYRAVALDPGLAGRVERVLADVAALDAGDDPGIDRDALVERLVSLVSLVLRSGPWVVARVPWGDVAAVRRRTRYARDPGRLCLDAPLCPSEVDLELVRDVETVAPWTGRVTPRSAVSLAVDDPDGFVASVRGRMADSAGAVTRGGR